MAQAKLMFLSNTIPIKVVVDVVDNVVSSKLLYSTEVTGISEALVKDPQKKQNQVLRQVIGLTAKKPACHLMNEFGKLDMYSKILKIKCNLIAKVVTMTRIGNEVIIEALE